LKIWRKIVRSSGKVLVVDRVTPKNVAQKSVHAGFLKAIHVCKLRKRSNIGAAFRVSEAMH